ncbi:transcriptional regulator [Microvirga brassicacearum]|uniref:Transcriptional regulator n=1 Tax=Microvirga brassicacearum TaxID=2580413 RepID=A0A5N3P8Z1_9HYPH|nr:transcriptional regulator [Microvirga brassicacearum]KAB0266204.1 transcriptional regulator [Microvirga brassicacearum]
MVEVVDTVFLDFEASSLGKHGYPIEVAWVFASGEAESHLIRPASSWTDWAAASEAIHGISRSQLVAEGSAVEDVGRRMVAVLTGHMLYATAPSWDGQWLSKLLRAAGLPRHALRLHDTELAHRNAVLDILHAADVPVNRHEIILRDILQEAQRRDDERQPPAHRALADAKRELGLWQTIRGLAGEIATRPV